ncbi:hypothetical protein A2662_03195 [Candidatus Giovannonibacteria bacterium RIFCSPHIGHO2_01_FULL_45_33]|uniref:VTT domain-containing protein n=1 Tax=Candidatus Giovannonibacteria bacterium RIFCSPLOWO2_01_FULL_45_34 TaxID=1798351 RepID=A0A1F5WZN2_9BACT|nr:MAG: hypothetical protein A2662_03195 [Candidatus Giovannonibacteria bacterium RIFCSPHIGHO2_01_FULL_45_33]OGF81079.1 MAG: hypothetical protein A2930_00720 [Candidatus Giovannonibacteria bacterium RIFCSPLOWO2_01_FULL_45_34]
MFGLGEIGIIALILQYGYRIIFFISVPEGPIVGVLAGFLAGQGYLNAVIVFFVLLAGDIFGDILHYAVGRWARRGFLERWGKYIGAPPEKMEKVEQYFLEHQFKILAFAKTQAIGGAFLLAAGAVKAPFGKFVWYNFVGTVPKVLILESIGFYFGQGIGSVGKYVDYFGTLSFVLGIIAVFVYIKYNKYAKKQTPDYLE